MVTKCIKSSLGLLVVALLIGGVLFGTHFGSYIFSSAKQLRSSVHQKIPTEFELKRASDLLDDIIPEMHATIRQISQEEVEVAALKADIARSQKPIAAEQNKISNLYQTLNLQQTSYVVGNKDFTRSELKDYVAIRFDRLKEAEIILASKQRQLEIREKSLKTALVNLEKTRSQKLLLANKIEALESQHRLIKASAIGSRIYNMDNSKLAQTEKLITKIKKRLDIDETALAHEARFVQSIDFETIDEQDLMTELTAYFSKSSDNKQLEENSDSQALCQADNLALKN
ncbi:MAG: hypothetical protein K9M57_08645 [Phycisphaerae bacterium]|nr:hypothetical protein [Phycisphaerae bacterium]